MNIGVNMSVEDNSTEILAEFEAAALRALERCGQQAEGFAQDLCPEDTGSLKNSISHMVKDRDA